MRKEHSQVFLM